MHSGTAHLQRKSVAGWTEYVEEAHTAAKDAFYLWHSSNRPQFGPVFNHLGKQELCTTMLSVTERS